METKTDNTKMARVGMNTMDYPKMTTHGSMRSGQRCECEFVDIELQGDSAPNDPSGYTGSGLRERLFSVRAKGNVSGQGLYVRVIGEKPGRLQVEVNGSRDMEDLQGFLNECSTRDLL